MLTRPHCQTTDASASIVVASAAESGPIATVVGCAVVVVPGMVCSLGEARCCHDMLSMACGREARNCLSLAVVVGEENEVVVIVLHSADSRPVMTEEDVAHTDHLS